MSILRVLIDDFSWDRKLNIRTAGSDYSEMNKADYGYDPTPYSVLCRLAESGYIRKEDVLVDFGCGKGRVSFYLNHTLGCRVIGIDCNAKRLRAAAENLRRYGNGADITFTLARAEEYTITEGNCFYFFNPFSGDVFQKVLSNIKAYQDSSLIPVRIFFYYPTSEYRFYFEREKRLLLTDEIDCTGLFSNDKSVYRILVFKIV